MMKRRELINKMNLLCSGITITGGISCKNKKKAGTILKVSGLDRI
jgi:hypothetical protein